MRNADQPGGRIFIEASRLAPFDVRNLRQTRIDAQANSGIAGLAVDASASVLAIAGFGPIRMTGGSTVFESDNWYEGDESRLIWADSGDLTYLGGEMAPYSHGVRKDLSADAPAVFLENFRGHATIAGGTMDLRRASNGLRVELAARDSAALFFGMAATVPDYFNARAGEGKASLLFSKRYSPGTGARDIPDVGPADLDFVLEGFRQARSVTWETTPMAHQPGATDVRIFRVFDADTGTGLRAGSW